MLINYTCLQSHVYQLTLSSVPCLLTNPESNPMFINNPVSDKYRVFGPVTHG